MRICEPGKSSEIRKMTSKLKHTGLFYKLLQKFSAAIISATHIFDSLIYQLIQNISGTAFGKTIHKFLIKIRLAKMSGQGKRNHNYRLATPSRLMAIFLLIGFLSFFWFSAKSNALTATLYPDGDVTRGWTAVTGCGSTSHWDCLNETTNSAADFVNTGTGGTTGEIEEYTLTSAASSNVSISHIRVIVYANNQACNGNTPNCDQITINMRIGGNLTTGQTYTLTTTNTAYAAAFSGTWASDSDLQIQVVRTRVGGGNSANADDDVILTSARAEIIYTKDTTFTQSSYRWFANSDSAPPIDVGSPLAANSTAATAPAMGTPFRLRLNIRIGTEGAAVGDAAFKLQYAERGNDNSCDSSFSAESYTNVQASSGVIRYYNNTTAANGDSLATNANDPTDGGNPLVRQTYIEGNIFTIQSTIATSSNGLWDFALVMADASGGQAYCIRAVKQAGTLLDIYSVVAEISAPTALLNQSNYRWFNHDAQLNFTQTSITNKGVEGTTSGTIFGTATSPDGTYVAYAQSASPYVVIFKRTGDTFTKLADPATLPAGLSASAAFSNDGTYLVIGHDVSPFITIYKRSGDTFTKLTNPATLPVDKVNSASFSGDDIYLALSATTVSIGQSPTIVYKRSGDTFTKLTDPPLPEDNYSCTGDCGKEVSFSSDGIYLAAASAYTPSITIYKRSGDSFSRLNPPDYPVLPDNTFDTIADTVCLSQDATYLGVGHNSSPFITVYKRSGDSFNRLSGVDIIPNARIQACKFSPDGKYLIAGKGELGDALYIYKREGDSFYKTASPLQIIANDPIYGFSFNSANTHLSIARNGDATGFNVQDGVFTRIINPEGTVTNSAWGVAISPDSKYVTFAHSGTPYISTFKRSGDSFAKLTNPTDLPAADGRGAAYSPDGTYLSISHDTTPFITIYKRSADTFTKLANPTDLPTGNGWDTEFSSDGVYLAVSHTTSRYITIYKRSGDTFTKLADPDVLPTATGRGVAFSPDTTYLAVGLASSPYIAIYKRSGDTFTKLTNPIATPTGIAYGATFSPNSNYLVIAHTTSPFVTIYERSGDTFTKLADPATLPTGNGWGAAFSSDGLYLSIAQETSPYVVTYRRSGNTFTKQADPSVIPEGQGRSIAISSIGYTVLGLWDNKRMHFYKSDISASIGSALASQNTPLDSLAENTPVRLRLLVRATNAAVPQNSGSYKLQYALRGGDNVCDSSFTNETYNNVTDSTSIRFYNGNDYAGKVGIQTSVDDPTGTGSNINQTHVVANPFTNLYADVTAGNNAVYDFALVNINASSGTYCFRVVKSDENPLDSYSVIPELTIAGFTPPVLNDIQIQGGTTIDSGTHIDN
jgi:hypothetical protein